MMRKEKNTEDTSSIEIVKCSKCKILFPMVAIHWSKEVSTFLPTTSLTSCFPGKGHLFLQVGKQTSR